MVTDSPLHQRSLSARYRYPEGPTLACLRDFTAQFWKHSAHSRSLHHPPTSSHPITRRRNDIDLTSVNIRACFCRWTSRLPAAIQRLPREILRQISSIGTGDDGSQQARLFFRSRQQLYLPTGYRIASDRYRNVSCNGYYIPFSVTLISRPLRALREPGLRAT